MHPEAALLKASIDADMREISWGVMPLPQQLSNCRLGGATAIPNQISLQTKAPHNIYERWVSPRLHPTYNYSRAC